MTSFRRPHEGHFCLLLLYLLCRFYDFFLFFCCRKSSAQCYSSSCCNHNTTVDLRNKRAKNNYTFPSCNNFFLRFAFFAYESFLCYSICCFEYKLIWNFLAFLCINFYTFAIIYRLEICIFSQGF